MGPGTWRTACILAIAGWSPAWGLDGKFVRPPLATRPVSDLRRGGAERLNGVTGDALVDEEIYVEGAYEVLNGSITTRESQRWSTACIQHCGSPRFAAVGGV